MELRSMQEVDQVPPTELVIDVGIVPREIVVQLVSRNDQLYALVLEQLESDDWYAGYAVGAVADDFR